MIPYITTQARPSAGRMNVLYQAFDTKLSTILGGRSFITAYKGLDFGGINPPVTLFGKTFFFTDGLTIFSNMLPGFIADDVTVGDPVGGGTDVVTGARPYNHTDFTDAVAAATGHTYDAVKRIATIDTFGVGYYLNGLTTQSGVSLFDHSLAAHTVEHLGQTYFLKEADCPIPEKRYKFALADIIIEGVVAVNLAGYDKYECVRLHNLQIQGCDVTLPDGTEVSLTAFECKTYRKSTAGAYESQFRYFNRFRGGDPRIFWHHASYANDGSASTLSDTVRTPAGSMAGNNLVNPVILYDFIAALVNSSQNFAWFNRDPHVLCDVGLQCKDLFDAIDPTGAVKADAIVGDLFHHKGKLTIRKVHNTDFDPELPGVKMITGDEVEFRGHSTIVADFAAKDITVDTDGSGNPRLETTDADHQVVLYSTHCNLLKTVNYGGDGSWYIIPTGVNINNPYTLESKVFEKSSAFSKQPTFGQETFNLATDSNYRISQRTLDSDANERDYVDKNGDPQTAVGDDTETLEESTIPAAGHFSGIHTAPVTDLLSLKYFGDYSLPSQDDDHVAFVDAALTLTPEGWVLTFTERVRADVLPDFTDPSYNATDYHNQFGNKLTFNEVLQKFELKHAVRFRKHGFGFGQFGKANVAFFPANYERLRVDGYEDEVSGVDGADFSYPDQTLTSTDVKLLRSVAIAELSNPTEGGRIFSVGRSFNLDGLVALMEHADLTDSANRFWYAFQIISLTSGDSSLPRAVGEDRLLSMPLYSLHYNGMAQAVNQLTTGRVMDIRALKLPHGPVVLSFDWEETGNGLESWPNYFGSTLPAPLNAFAGISGGPGTLADYWVDWFTEKGIAIRSTDGLPDDWADFKDEWNERRDVTCDISMEVNGAACAGTRVKNGTHWWYFTGSVEMEISDFVVGPAIQVSQHLATVAVRSVPPGFNIVNLSTAYNALRWIAVDEFKDFCEDVGFPFLFADVFTPVRLDFLERPTVLKEGVPTSSLSQTYTGEIGERDSGIFSANPAPSTGHASAVSYAADLNALTASETKPLNDAFTVLFKTLAFRLAEEDEFEVDAHLWKLPIATTEPPESFHAANRSEGKYGPFSVSNPTETHYYGLWALHLAGTVGGSGPSLTITNATRPASGGAIRYQFTPPYFPADYAVYTTVGQYSSMAFLLQAGPRLFKEYDFDGDPFLRAERFMRWVNEETDWIACRVVASAGIVASQDFYVLPRGQWGREIDWWEFDSDAWLSMFCRIADPVPRWIPPTGAPLVASVFANAGATIFQPGPDTAHIAVYDPLQLQTAL